MAQLAKFRRGWLNENLAQCILYKFAFTANPSKIADDIGIDFICTLFETKKKKRTIFLYPKNSFAIQIKSNKSNIDISKKIDLLNNLELPFYIGVVDQKGLKLSIYSGEFLQLFFSHKGTNFKLKIKLCERAEVYSTENYYEKVGDDSFLLYFPYLTKISIHENYGTLQEKISLIQQTSSTILDNISSKRNHEYIFKINACKSSQLFMFAGSGSASAFRGNFINRITETFYNLNWLFDNNPNFVNLDEYQMYKNLYKELGQLDIYKPLPKFLVDSYESLEDKMKNYCEKDKSKMK